MPEEKIPVDEDKEERDDEPTLVTRLYDKVKESMAATEKVLEETAELAEEVERLSDDPDVRRRLTSRPPPPEKKK